MHVLGNNKLFCDFELNEYPWLLAPDNNWFIPATQDAGYFL